MKKELLPCIINALEELKAVDIKVCDVRHLTSMTDHIVICSGRSSRQLKSLAENVAVNVKKEGFGLRGQEGSDASGWIIVDAFDVVVHVMHPDAREFYALEDLWDVSA